MSSVALVTGSTSNIGRAVAERLAADGHHVVVTSRNGAEAAAAAEQLATPGTGLEVDFARPGLIDALFATVAERWTCLDVLVNNVAHTENESVLHCDLATWERTVATNLTSYLLCTRLAAQQMIAAGRRGTIVNVGISSTRGYKDKFSYTVTKGAIHNLTMCAALDLAEYGIRVNTVGSGMVGSPVGSRDMAGRPLEIPRIPLGHVGQPADVANAVAFLASDEAAYVTGSRLDVDGGLNSSA
jgi:NAD(P)-dependent dehydrogenase (short-subunit alcohol dehydrogenase family)